MFLLTEKLNPRPTTTPRDSRSPPCWTSGTRPRSRRASRTRSSPPSPLILSPLARIGRIVVVAGTKSAEEAKDLGATHVVDRTGKSGREIAAEVRVIVGDELLYALDTINPPESQWIGVEALSNSQTGKLARLIPRGVVDESQLSVKKGAGFETVNVMGVSTARPATAGPLWNRVPGWVAQGKITPTGFQVLRGLDVDAVNKVLDGYSSGAETGHWQVHL
ncbi:hypothetical protein BP00DRAFT_93299 [Aspergillus indologenus CBS 114.80]|uniref:Alcohol dehydrogenase-like C-terminal domain-containing protein n=1 Tax=Aspergillus indologenus CBS 114.80 TaxID=1450541 RepID=A0A2V5HMG5_9EURO|nr:hypothetical protein BP00DRAFT_93299 [Aspergillus indologenus CBS 114.80]